MPSSSAASAAHSISPDPAAPTRTEPRPRNLLLRLHWMLFGYAALGICALLIARGGHSIVSSPSLAMGVVAVSMVAARWLDITRYDGLTADGEPASPHHLRRYALAVAGVTAALLAAAAAIA